MDENKLSTEFETYFTSAKQASTLSLQKGKNSAIIDGAQTITEEYPPVMLNQSTNDETSLLCNDCDCDSDCNHFNDMSTAINLSLNSWHRGEICCPRQEVWYKFTPTATAYYTFYTVGVLDTTGYLYDADGSQIDTDANNGTGTNFKIVAYLTAGETYYLKTTAFDNSTGSFSIAVTNTVFVDYISIDQSYVSLNKGETEALTVTVSPSYATNKNLYWTSSNTSVATVSQTGVVTATGAGTACICAHSQDGSNKSSCCAVTVRAPINGNIDVSMLTPVSGNRYLTQDEMENNALIIYDYLRNKVETPWSKNAICALLGNMEAESTINPGRWQDGVGPGYGLVQWTPASKWQNWAMTNHYAEDNLFGQLCKILNEVAMDGVGVWNDNIHQWQKFRVNPEMPFRSFTISNKSVDELSTVFLKCYERPNDQSNSVITYRQELCSNWLTYLNGVFGS